MGFLSGVGLLCLSLAWSSGSAVASNKQPSCDCPAGTEVAPSPSPVAVGAICVTQEKYLALAKLSKEAGVQAACAPLGQADIPSVRDAAIPNANTPLKTYRLYFHVFRENNGANPAASQADVENAVTWLNANFAPWRIQFTYQWRFVNNTTYRYLASNEEFQMKKNYALTPATNLNIYVVDTGGVCWGTFPWMSQSLTAQGGVVMHQNWFVATTRLPSILTHEVGHCVGLWHVFHGNTEVAQCSDCYEAAGRTPQEGDVTGDLCSDTNATTNANFCGDPAGTDPCSGLPYTDTPFANFMSYANACQTSFSPHQAGRMHAWTATNLMGWLALPNPPGVPTLSKVDNSVTIVWADNSTDEIGFQVQREKKGNGNKWSETTTVASVGPDVTSASDTPGIGTFRYRVRSQNAAGYSIWTTWSQITF